MWEAIADRIREADGFVLFLMFGMILTLIGSAMKYLVILLRGWPSDCTEFDDV